MAGDELELRSCRGGVRSLLTWALNRNTTWSVVLMGARGRFEACDHRLEHGTRGGVGFVSTHIGGSDITWTVQTAPRGCC